MTMHHYDHKIPIYQKGLLWSAEAFFFPLVSAIWMLSPAVFKGEQTRMLSDVWRWLFNVFRKESALARGHMSPDFYTPYSGHER